MTVDDILIRQYWLGGVDLYAPPSKLTNYQHPFAVEREEFIRNFYDYVCAAKPGAFKLRWSEWVVSRAGHFTSGEEQ